jgi:phosphomannomutase
MIPWLLAIELISKSGLSLSQLVDQRMLLFPASGEINRTIADPTAAIALVQAHYKPSAEQIDFTDGLSMEFTDWRFNLRCSNTEPLVRLNVEARGNTELMQAKTQELLALLTDVKQ